MGGNRVKLYIVAFVISAVCWLLAYFYRRNGRWLNPLGWAYWLGGVVAMLMNR